MCWPTFCAIRSSPRRIVEVERGVILQEIGQTLDTPGRHRFRLGARAGVSRSIHRPSDSRTRPKTWSASTTRRSGGSWPSVMRPSAPSLAAAAGAVDHGDFRQARRKALRRPRAARRRHRCAGALPRRRATDRETARTGACGARVFRARAIAARISSPRRSMRRCSAAGCRRGCSKRSARRGASVTRSTRRPSTTPTPGL